MPLNSILEKILGELRTKEAVQLETQRDMRKATRLSKQAIFLTHQERFEAARELLDDASTLFSRLRETTENYPDLYYKGIVSAAFEEYSEARTFLSLIEEDRFIDPSEFSVPFVPFLLGLGDVVGELRRRALDSIRREKVGAAEKALDRMEHIYSELAAMEEAFLLVSGLRRKWDVARRLIEITRGDVTIEARRSALKKTILRLEKALAEKRKPRNP
jgi:translin